MRDNVKKLKESFQMLEVKCGVARSQLKKLGEEKDKLINQLKEMGFATVDEARAAATEKTEILKKRVDEYSVKVEELLTQAKELEI